MTKPTLLNWIALFSLGIIWGGSFMGAKVALDGFGPLSVAAIRLAIGASLLFVITISMGRKIPSFSNKLDRRIWIHIIAMGLFTNAIPFSLLNWGQLYVSSGFAGVTMAVVPLLVLPLSHFLLKDQRMSLIKTLGFLIGFIGIVILIGPKDILSGTGANLEPIARLACIAAACCYAIGAINTRLCPPVSTMAFSAAGLLVGAFIMVPLALFIEGVPDIPTTLPALATIYLGVFPTALATVLLVWVINSAGPTFLSLVNYQVPLWAVVFGVVFLNENVPPSFATALALILLGLAVSQWRRSKT